MNHCAHGKDATSDLVILDWRPFEYKTEKLGGLPMNIAAHCTTRFTPIEKGTRVTTIYDRPSGESLFSRVAAWAMLPLLYNVLKKYDIRGGAIIQKLIEQHAKEEKLAIKEPV